MEASVKGSVAQGEAHLIDMLDLPFGIITNEYLLSELIN